jgi:23S rRNA pseudouridine1911/1915/1917 synthase
MSTTSYVVLPGVRRARADKILATAFQEHSRVAFQRSFDNGLVRMGGQPITRDHAVSEGDVLEFSFPEARPAGLRAVNIPLEIVYEDRHLLAINKPAGMVVHPGAGTAEDTLVHALLAHCKGSLSGVGGVERPGIVHRLDRETSGIILAAKTDAAHRGLSAQFAGRTLQKEYLALVAGAPALLSGSIRKAIGRNKQHRHKMAVVDAEQGGREAHTDWEVAERFGDLATLIRCTIHTGRTHQIRVHLKALGHVILGDVIYGWKPDPRLPVPAGRVMLHAEHLVFAHPVSGKALDLRAPLPADFEAQLTQLRKVAKAAAKTKRLTAGPPKPRKPAALPSYHVHESRA